MVAYATPVAPRQRSNWVEVASTREHPAVRRRHVYDFHTDFDCLGIYGKRKHHGLRQEEPGLQSSGSRESSGNDTALLH